MEVRKHIALVAHDNKKRDLIEWVEWNYELLLGHSLICTGTTGRLVEEALWKKLAREGKKERHADITKLKSGPLGGDQQLGSMIVDGKVDILIFLWDPMEPHPHDVDVKALLRIAVLYNIPMACSRSSADFVISSPLMKSKYDAVKTDYSEYIKRSF